MHMPQIHNFMQVYKWDNFIFINVCIKLNGNIKQVIYPAILI